MQIRIGKVAGRRGQNLIEYGLILSIVAVALLGMQVYFRRGIQSVIKVAADDYAGYRAQGDPVGNLEAVIKNAEYKKRYDKIVAQSDTTGSWDQTVRNDGDSSIYTQLKGSSTSTSGSFSISGDYKTRKLDE